MQSQLVSYLQNCSFPPMTVITFDPSHNGIPTGFQLTKLQFSSHDSFNLLTHPTMQSQPVSNLQNCSFPSMTVITFDPSHNAIPTGFLLTKLQFSSHDSYNLWPIPQSDNAIPTGFLLTKLQFSLYDSYNLWPIPQCNPNRFPTYKTAVFLPWQL